MKKYSYILFVLSIWLFGLKSFAQVFPIAISPADSYFTFSVGTSGSNYLVPLLTETSNGYEIYVQIVDNTGALIGSRLNLNATTNSMGVSVASDGVMYVIVWRDLAGNVKAQFVNQSAALFGSTITIASVNSPQDDEFPTVVWDGTNYMISYQDNNGTLKARRCSNTGLLVGNEITIGGPVKDAAQAFDGVNHLFVWTVHQTNWNDIRGQFVAKDGSKVGADFMILSANTVLRRDNPVSLAFNGNNYCLAYHEQGQNVHKWFIKALTINSAGTIGTPITVCDTVNDPIFGMTSGGNNKFLITWTQNSTAELMGQYFTSGGVAIGNPFVTFGYVNDRIPFGANTFNNGEYFVVATRFDSLFVDGDADVFGKILTPDIGVEEQFAWNFEIAPNPAMNKISFVNCEDNKDVFQLKIFDVFGRLISTQSGLVCNEDVELNLPAGIYLLEIFDGSNYRFIRQVVN